VTPRQWIALNNPCARAYQTLDRRFLEVLFDVSTILTVNK
jgi:hypothetical protein